jgi:hypothetical protein
VSPGERRRFNFLAGLIHQGTLMPLPLWLLDEPGWVDEFVVQLLDDGVVYLFTASHEDVFERVEDPQTRLSQRDARALLTSPAAAHNASEVWLAPTRAGRDRFSEVNVSALFAYVSDERPDT